MSWLKERHLREYQKTAIQHILDHSHCGLFLDMGLGKTVSTLTAIKKLIYEEFEITRVLIVAPKRVAEHVWADERWRWYHLHRLQLSVISGTAYARRKGLYETSDIYVIGRDNLVWLIEMFKGKDWPFDMLVVDESSSFKNPNTKRFKALRSVQPLFRRVVLLTGTPAPNTLLDLWSQLYLLDRGERLGKFITNYRDTYFRPAKRNGNIVYTYDLRSGAEQQIYDKISDICISMKSEDYLELPEVINNTVYVKFGDYLRRQYNKFEEEMIMELLGEEEITAVNAAALTNKLLQYANGAVYDDAHTYHIVHDLKIEALYEIIENSEGRPVLVAWAYRHDLHRLMKTFAPMNPRQLNNNQDIEDWNAGKIKLLLMHPASGGHGLNLQSGGNIIVWFGQTWSLELYQQLNKRLHRPGQTMPVIIHHIIAHNTMEMDVMKALAKKGKTQDNLLNAVKARVRYVQNNRKQGS